MRVQHGKFEGDVAGTVHIDGIDYFIIDSGNGNWDRVPVQSSIRIYVGVQVGDSVALKGMVRFAVGRVVQISHPAQGDELVATVEYGPWGVERYIVSKLVRVG